MEMDGAMPMMGVSSEPVLGEHFAVRKHFPETWIWTTDAATRLYNNFLER